MKRAAELDAAGWGPKKPESAAAIWVNAPGVAVQVQQWERTVNRQPVAAVYPAGTHRSFSAAELVANRRRCAPATRAGGGSGMTEDLRVDVAAVLLLVPKWPTPPLENLARIGDKSRRAQMQCAMPRKADGGITKAAAGDAASCLNELVKAVVEAADPHGPEIAKIFGKEITPGVRRPCQ